jgi:hypothetical protein
MKKWNTFEEACLYIQDLPYKRNENKENIFCVIEDEGGTCSSKHAFLKHYANENNIENVKLILGIFKMNSKNTPKISKVLEKYNLKEIPEAHNYLKIHNKIHDYTRKNSKPEDFENDLVEEIEILPSQITTFKIKYHQKFIKKYLKENPEIHYSAQEFWLIREKSISALQN